MLTVGQAYVAHARPGTSPEGAMTVTSAREQQLGTYRCPVCGHRDEVSLDAEGGSRILTCTYCDTALEVSARGPDSVRFSVQVAE